MQALRLAAADLRRDWALSLCQIFALAAVLTPLLVLAGLRQGVLGQLMDGLRTNPSMREIEPRVTGTNRFTEAWLAEMRSRPDVAFIVGDTRFTAASVTATLADGSDHAPVVVTFVPTAADDPLRPAAATPWANDAGTVVLSSLAAREIGAQPGSRLALRVPRRRDGADEGQTLAVTVASVLPADSMEGRRTILATAPLVLAVQQFRDGAAIPAFGWPGRPLPDGPPHYERFRMYARQIDDVGPLVDFLKADGIEPVSRIEDIAPVQALDNGLSVVLLIVAAFAASGLVVAVGATQWNGVQRKRRELALLALIGYGRGFLVGMALTQALMLGAAGILVSLLLFYGAALSIDAVFVHFQRLTGPACQLSARDLTTASALTLTLTLVASALAAWQIARIEPAEILREA
jgi:putative ABC transport system permease protein